MKAIITVLGGDRVGIIAAVSTLLAERNVNILDISQTIMQNTFTMFMMVDLQGAPFDELLTALREAGERLGVSIRIQHADMFEAMHRI